MILDVARRTSDVLLRDWRFVTTPPLTGQDNMRYDAQTLERVGLGELPPTVRFFRFREPTVTYGHLQKIGSIRPLVPQGWDTAQRPTGGGLVFHEHDLCLSLCWRKGQSPIPPRPREMYRWIHAVIRKGLGGHLQTASCADACAEKKPFALRDCFKEPVGYDLLSGSEKVVGGALRSTREAVLYQGSIQIPMAEPAAEALRRALDEALTDPHV